jgi:HEAT repeat protein
MESLAARIGQFVPQLLPFFLQFSRDESDDVRNNAIFGAGEMVFYGKEAVFPYPFLQSMLLIVW